MATLNPLARELVLKIVYYGPGLGGKTTTLEYLHKAARAETKGRLVSLATPVDRTLYFDFLPLRIPAIHGLQVRLQLFTVPGQVHFNATRKLVLTGADGVVFVADSQPARLDANLESLENLRENLEEQRAKDTPIVFAHNKRDLPGVLGVEELEEALNPSGLPSIGTSARTGQGVFEALDLVVNRILATVESKLPPSVSHALPSFDPAEGELVAAIRRISSLPPPLVPTGSLRQQAAEHSTAPAEVEAPKPLLETERSAQPADPIPAVPPPARAPGAPASEASRDGAVFAELWSTGDDRDLCERVFGALRANEAAEAILLAEELLGRTLDRARLVFELEGSHDAVATSLGIPAPLHLRARSIARRVRLGAQPTVAEAMVILLVAAQARVATEIAG